MANYLITGATSGIGLACTEHLAKKDNKLILVGRNTAKLDELSHRLPGEIVGICYDLSDSVGVKAMFDVCEERGIKLDGMIYSAGMDELCPVKAINIATTQKIMAVNCLSFVAMCKVFYSKRISNDNSSIIAISSLGSVLNEKGMISYSMSKAALNSAVKTTAKEFARRGIRVNAILPGGVNTRMGAKKGAILHEVALSAPKLDEEQPLGAIQTSGIVKMVDYLLDKDDNYCTGELITISGGRAFNL